MTWPTEGLRHFNRAEFDHPDQMHPLILWLVDEARERSGVPFQITSDGRTDEETEALYPDIATRPDSPHPRFTAIDGKPRPFNADTRMKWICAVTSIYVEGSVPNLGFEIANRHFHMDVDAILRRPHFWLGRSK